MNDRTSDRPSAASVIRTGQPSARISHTRHGVSNETVLSKMIRDSSVHARARGDHPYLGNFGYLHEVSDGVSNNIEDALNLNQLQPEVEICIQILTSMILSPKDITDTNLSHQVEPNVLPAEMTGEMLEVLKKHFEHNYKIRAQLPEKLRKALFIEGADVTIIIPENSLDDLINGRNGKKMTMESFRTKQDLVKDLSKPTGFMGVPGAGRTRKGMALEDLLGDLGGVEAKAPETLGKMNIGDFSKITSFLAPEIYDNPSMMKLEEITSSALNAKRRTVLEGLGTASYGDIESLYHSSNLRPEDVVIVGRQEEASRETIGAPLNKTAPTEATIPVHAPGRPDKAIGFLFLLDEFGSFISRASRTDYFRSIQTGVFNNRNALSGMLSSAAKQLQDEDGFASFQMAQQATAAFRDMAIRDIEGRLLAGTVGNVTVSRQELAYDLMLERAFASKQTRIVYVPADMVVYWAYRYNDNGTGRSLLEDNKILSSIRALTLFMNVETMIRNSIDHRTLDIVVDEDDPNKSRTKEMILHEYARQRNNSIPWATSNPRRMIEMAQQSGLAINVEGGDNYPNTKVSVNSRDIQYREVNLDMDEDLRKRQTMGFGLAPEIVDLSNQIEFSSKIATSNELSLKRALIWQDITNGFIRQTIIKTTISHKGLMDQLKAIVGKHIDKVKMKAEVVAELGVDYFVQLFFSIYSVKLPRPDNGLASRMTDLEEFSAAVDKMLDVVLPDEMLDAKAIGTSSNEWIGIVKASVKSTLCLRYCRENNIMPQFTDLFKNDTEEDYGSILVKDSLDSTSRLSKIIQGVGLRLYSASLISDNQWATLKERMDKERVAGVEPPEGGPSDSSYDGGGGQDEFNFDSPDEESEFNLDSDTPEEEELSPEEETPEEEPGDTLPPDDTTAV